MKHYYLNSVSELYSDSKNKEDEYNSCSLYCTVYCIVLGYEKQKRQRGGGGGVMGGGGCVMAAWCVRFSKHNCVAAVV